MLARTRSECDQVTLRFTWCCMPPGYCLASFNGNGAIDVRVWSYSVEFVQVNNSSLVLTASSDCSVLLW